MQQPPDNQSWQQPQNEPSPQTGTSYPLYEMQPTYEQGYRPMPQPAPPVQLQWYPPQYPPQQYPMQPPPQYYPQPMPYPQQQQMMYPPQMMPPQIVINNSMTQQTMIGMRGRPQQLSFAVRLLYFLCIGCWLGTIWAMIAGFFCCTFIGLGIGIMMFRALPAVFTLSRK